MTRARLSLVVVACALACVGAAWIAAYQAVDVDAPGEAAPPAGPPSDGTEQSGSGPHVEVASARKKTAPRKPAIAPARLILHVTAAEDGAAVNDARVDVSCIPDWPRTATVDADGVVRIDASAPGVVPATVKLRVRVAAPGRVREIVSADVASGEERTSTVALRRAFGVDGIVHDSFGRPIAGARVTAREAVVHPLNETSETLSEDESDDLPSIEDAPPVADAVSADDGRFRVDGLPPRASLVYEVAARRHVTRWISRRAHDAHPLDVQLDAAGVVRGVVRSPAGAPVAGARVTARPPARSDGRLDSDVGERSGAPTGTDGRFEIDALPLGVEFTLVAKHDGFMQSDDSSPIALSAARDEASCDLALRPAGRLDVELVSAVKRDGCVAQLRWDDGDETTTCSVPGRTSHVVRAPGPLTVDVRCAGLRHVSAEAEVGPGETRTLKIELDEGESLAGLVVDDEGWPVAGAVVTVDPESPAEQHATSAADGTFAMKGVVFQIHKVHATAARHATHDFSGMSSSVTWMRIDLPRDGEVALRLRVPDGAPRPGKRRIKWIGPSPVDEDVARWSDDQVVRAWLPPGRWSVAVEVNGYVTWKPGSPFSVFAGGRTHLGEAMLDPGLPLTGRVVDVDGNGVPDADVSIDGDIFRTDAAGQFKAAHVAMGYHDVGTPASPDFLETAPTRIRVDGDSQPIVLTVHRGAVLRVTLHGTITASMGAGIHVEVAPVDPPDGGRRESLFKETPDRWSARLHDGSRRIVVSCKGTLATKEVVLRDGVDVSVDVDLAQ